MACPPSPKAMEDLAGRPGVLFQFKNQNGSAFADRTLQVRFGPSVAKGACCPNGRSAGLSPEQGRRPNQRRQIPGVFGMLNLLRLTEPRSGGAKAIWATRPKGYGEERVNALGLSRLIVVNRAKSGAPGGGRGAAKGVEGRGARANSESQIFSDPIRPNPSESDLIRPNQTENVWGGAARRPIDDCGLRIAERGAETFQLKVLREN